MKYLKMFENDNKKGYFYKIESGSYLICDVNQCTESERTFDIYFFDLVKNKRLQQILFKFKTNRKDVLIDYLASSEHTEKSEHLMKNPKLRILVQDKNLFIDVLEIFHPEDIRVVSRKYNI